MATRKTASRSSSRPSAGKRVPVPPPRAALPPPPPPPPPRSTDPIVFIVRGDQAPARDGAARGAAAGAATREIRIADASRAATTPEHRIEAMPGLDIVELVVAARSGERITLTLSPESARDLLLSQEGAAAGLAREAGPRAAARGAPGEVRVPVNARWAMPPDSPVPDAASRSFVGDLFFDTLRLVGLDPRDALAKASAEAIRGWRDRQVDEGVYRLAQTQLAPLKGQRKVKLNQVAAPQLVLIHGTFVDTTSTFGKWWSHHPALVRSLFDAYRNEVYALDHATLGKSPIANALTLARALPDGARLHLVTHSRGGLVAEALARACTGIGDADLAFFAGDGYAGYRTDLQALGRELQGRKITVERIVRVACPAHGTYLASGRLDAYFSVLGHLLDRAGMPLAGDGTAFIGEIARRRSRPEDFPGLESMMPSHPVAQWAGSPGSVQGDLRVVAGDVEPNLLDSWLRALAAYALYPVFMDDNDLVVQTSSMYGGAQRQGGASFLLERGSRTDHVSYFANDSTANAITQALLLPQPQGFLPIGPSSRAGLDASGARAARRSRAASAADGSRPAVIVLPGIMGSNLRSADGREWLVWWRLPGLVGRIAWRDDNPIEPDGPIEDYYGELMDYLERSHDVVPVAFDWRAPLAHSAARLAEQLAKELTLRKASGQPVRILAHSMGGLVARVMQLDHADLWDEMMKRDGASFVMLGTPNGGSWAPMTIFTADDRFGRTLASVGGLLREKWARDRFAEFQGLVQMQAGLLDETIALSQRPAWEQLAQRDEALAEAGNSWHNPEGLKDFYRWAIPAQAALTDAAALRRRLDDQAVTLAAGGARMAVVLGQADSTPCGIDASATDIGYQFTAEGDGRVTWVDACLPGVPAWRADPDHGSLPKATHLFKAYEDLLVKGTTSDQRLSPHTPGAGRGTGAAGAARQAPVAWRGRTRGLQDAPLPLESDLLREAIGGSLAQRPRTAVPAARALGVKVQHGDVRFIGEPLLIGHSSALELTGSEYVIDELLGGALHDSLGAGLYPDAVGEQQIFDNNRPDPQNPWGFARPRAVIVVGLGSEGDLKPAGLRDTVRRGVLAYLQRVAEQRKQGLPAGAPPDTTPVSLAMTSVGSGGSLTVAQSVVNAIHAVQDANAQLPANKGQPRWPGVAEVMLIELYQSRAAEAWQSLRLAIASGELNAVLAPTVAAGRGGLSRPLEINYRGADHDLIRVASGVQFGLPSTEVGPGVTRTLDFTLFTHRARSEVRAKGTQPALVNAVVAAAERSTRTDRELGRALYQLLVPLELRPYLGGGCDLVLELDPVAAQYPWEMMDDYDARPGAAGSDKPLGLRMGSLLRRLALRDFRANPVDSPVDDVLVLGMSRVKSFRGLELPELAGVRDEVNAITDRLKGSNVTPLLDEPFLTVIKSALSRPWKVVHLAGHGIHEQGGSSGMILADDTVFGPMEFDSMGQVPELVFVNCCHLGKTDEPSSLLQRNVFAANVAEQLIRMGVRCVVAAGWAVDDRAASAFAGKFYENLIAGDTFAGAVHAARMAAYAASPGSNTWGAYQCYGDAAWRLHNAGTDGQQGPDTSSTPAMATEMELLARLEAIEVAGGSADAHQHRALVESLRQLLGAGGVRVPWFDQGKVAEAVARSWNSLGDADQAIAWYERALAAPDGSASLKAREQQLNLLARNTATSQEARLEVLAKLQVLVEISPTAERFNLMGSTRKRLAMKAGSKSEVRKHLIGMRDAYAKAEALNPPEIFYPAIQKFLAELRLQWLAPRDRASAPADITSITRLRQLLVDKEKQGVDFWSVVGHTELDIYEAMLRGQLGQEVDGILRSLADTRKRASRPGDWRSVADTARFVLEPYRESAPAREQQAVDKLLQQLAAYGA